LNYLFPVDASTFFACAVGIWGSAFSILLNRVVDIEKHVEKRVEKIEKRCHKLGETARQELGTYG
jgi:hypothetical protein